VFNLLVNALAQLMKEEKDESVVQLCEWQQMECERATEWG